MPPQLQGESHKRWKLENKNMLLGAIALGFWAEPRRTLDVDCTLYLAADKPSECIWLLQEIGCTVAVNDALRSLQEHSFCRVGFATLQIDVFLPTIPFYEAARARRRRVALGDQKIMIWDAETLAVFKLMFFRRNWIRQQLVDIYGPRDARLQQWEELVNELPI